MGVKRPLCWESQTTVLRPEERLAQLRPDYHVRRGKDGEHKAFLCEDKQRRHLICTQKLTLLAEHINKLVGDGDRSDRISATSLYNILTNDGSGLNSGFSKHRWKVRSYPLDSVIEEFESTRPSFEIATVLGSKQCVQTKLCV